MYENFGAVVTGEAVEFQLFLPDTSRDPGQYVRGGLPRIRDVRVVGDFQRDGAWNLDRAPVLERREHPSGWLYVHRIPQVGDGFYQYKYLVDFENGTRRWCTDPCTRYVGPSFENAGFVIGGNTAAARPLPEPRRVADLVIYELMLDDFTAGYRGDRAPADAVADRIDYLLELGVNTVEFMPWTAWRGGAFSWGYDPVLFFAVENRYIEDPSGPLDRLYRLKRLVSTLHDRGLGVIMDGVFNHVNAGVTPDTGFPYHWLYQDPEDSPYTGTYAGGGFFEDLDWHNGCTEQFILDACRFWLDEYQLDGIRFDYTRGFFERDQPDRGISSLITDLRSHLRAQGRDQVALLIEHLTDNRYEAVNDTNVISASGCWFDPMLFEVSACAASERVTAPLLRALDAGRDFVQAKSPITYVENHDHSTLCSLVGGRASWYRMQPAAIALMTTPGAVLVHNGQEFGDDWWLPESGDGRVVPRPLKWPLAEDAAGAHLRALYRRLAEIRRDHPALRTPNFYPSGYDERHTRFDPEGYGVDVDRGLAVYHRWGSADDGTVERIMVVVNFSPFDQWLDVPLSVNGTWLELMDGGRFEVTDWRLPGHRIPSHWGHIFANRA
jgi:pullulanase